MIDGIAGQLQGPGKSGSPGSVKFYRIELLVDDTAPLKCAMSQITDCTTDNFVALPIIQCVNTCQFSCPSKQLQQ